MRTLYCRIVFVVMISTLIIFLAGCAIGIRPRSYDVPPEDDTYYEESVYSSYYDVGPRTSIHYSDPNYDPWTMGTYYQRYSGTPRADRSSGSSDTGGARSENKRPAVKGRDSTSVHQSRAPSNEGTSLRRKSTVRERRKTSSEPSSSSTTHQKVRRDVKQRRTQTSRKKEPAHEKQKKDPTQTNPRKARRKPVKSGSEEEDEGKKKTPQD